MQEEQEIGRELFGYRKDDVDRLLAELHRDLKTAKEEIDGLRQQLSSAQEKLGVYEDASTTLNKTMIDAEKHASEILDEAKQEAETILTKAKSEAGTIIEAADTEREALEARYKALEKAEKDLHAKVKAIIDNYLGIIESEMKQAQAPAKAATTAPFSAPEPEAVAAKKEAMLPQSVDRKIIDTLARLGDIQGVSTAWIFDDTANIVSSFNRLKIDLPRITRSLTSLEEGAEKLEKSLEDGKINLVFMQLSKVVLIVSPLTEHAFLGVLASVNAPIGQIFWYLDKETPSLKQLLS